MVNDSVGSYKYFLGTRRKNMVRRQIINPRVTKFESMLAGKKNS